MPQILHSFTKLGFSAVYSKQLKGHTTVHAPQPAHFLQLTTFLANDSSKLTLVGVVSDGIKRIMI
jgi:hypothetical protein